MPPGNWICIASLLKLKFYCCIVKNISNQHVRARASWLGSGWHSPDARGRTALLVDASEEGSVARVLADRVKKRVHAHESHVEAVLVKRMVEGVECVVEFVDPKIVNTDLVSSAGFR